MKKTLKLITAVLAFSFAFAMNANAMTDEEIIGLINKNNESPEKFFKAIRHKKTQGHLGDFCACAGSCYNNDHQDTHRKLIYKTNCEQLILTLKRAEKVVYCHELYKMINENYIFRKYFYSEGQIKNIKACLEIIEKALCKYSRELTEDIKNNKPKLSLRRDHLKAVTIKLMRGIKICEYMQKEQPGIKKLYFYTDLIIKTKEE